MENFDKQIGNILQSIPKQYHKEARAFDEMHIREGLALASRVKYLKFLKYNLPKLNGKPLKKVTIEDIERIILQARKEGLSSAWIHHQSITLKKFFTFIGNKELEDKIKAPKMERKMPDEILTPEEVLALAKAATHPRDRAMIMVLYDSGARIGELCYGLKIKHVVFDNIGAKLLVDGKTGQRPIRLTYAVGDLKTWIEHHPQKDNPEAPVFISSNGSNPLDTRSVNRIIKGVAKRIGLKKKIHPHLFRHSRFSHLGNKLTDKQLMMLAGWKTRAMVDTYTHLSMRDIEDKLLEIQGMKKVEEKPIESPLTPKICGRCKKENSATSKFCDQCGAVLTVEVAVELEEKRGTADNALNELIKDKEFLEVIARKLANKPELIRELIK